MAMGKKQDIGDIIRDAIEGQRAPKKTKPKKFNPASPKRRSIRERQELAKKVGSKAERVRTENLRNKYGK